MSERNVSFYFVVPSNNLTIQYTSLQFDIFQNHIIKTRTVPVVGVLECSFDMSEGRKSIILLRIVHSITSPVLDLVTVLMNQHAFAVHLRFHPESLTSHGLLDNEIVEPLRKHWIERCSDLNLCLSCCTIVKIFHHLA